MKEIIYIVDYSNTLEKQINLLNLIKGINREVYDVCVSSHCVLPEWIIELCDYYFYDKNNDLLYDPFLQEFRYYTNEVFEIWYKSIQVKSTWLLAILRLNLPTFTFLKSLGYKVVHTIEYDTKIKNLDELKDNSILLENHDVVAYIHPNKTLGNTFENPLWIHGCFLSLNLSSFKFNEFNFDRDVLIKILYTHSSSNVSCAQEKTAFDYIWKSKKIYKKPLEKALNSFNLNLVTSNNSEFSKPQNNLSIFKKDNQIYLYFNNTNSLETHNIQLIFDNSQIYNYQINPRYWTIQSIKNIPLKSIQLLLNGNTIKTYNMKDKFDIEYLTSTILNFK